MCVVHVLENDTPETQLNNVSLGLRQHCSRGIKDIHAECSARTVPGPEGSSSEHGDRSTSAQTFRFPIPTVPRAGIVPSTPSGPLPLAGSPATAEAVP